MQPCLGKGETHKKVILYAIPEAYRTSWYAKTNNNDNNKINFHKTNDGEEQEDSELCRV